MKSLKWLAISILFSSIAIAQNGGLKFSLTDLGTFVLGGYQSEAWAINNNGQIVGDYVWNVYRKGSGQGCFFKLPGQTAVVFGNNPCTARAVNASGAIAGWTHFGGGFDHAFRRDVSGNLYDLPPLVTDDGDSFSEGFGIDSSGRVVGYGEADSYFQKATQWDLGGHPAVFGCTSADGSIALATNPAGNILVGQCSSIPFGWFSGVGISFSNLSPMCPVGWVFAMNNGNYMVGRSDDANCSYHAVLWDHGAVDLGPGTAYGISGDKWIVGITGSGIGTGSDLGFLRVPDPNCPQPVNLNLLLDSSGSGWSVNAAYGINDSHQIVGQARAPNGQYHAILLTQANNLPLCYPD